MSPALLSVIVAGAFSLGVGFMTALSMYRTKRLEVTSNQRVLERKQDAEIAINHENKLYDRVEKVEAQVAQYQRDIMQYQTTMLAQERDCNRRINDLRDTIAAMAGETADNRRMLDSIGCGRADCAARMLIQGRRVIVESNGTHPTEKASDPTEPPA